LLNKSIKHNLGSCHHDLDKITAKKHYYVNTSKRLVWYDLISLLSVHILKLGDMLSFQEVVFIINFH